MTEYILIFSYDGNHRTAITGSDTAQGIITYIHSNLAEMQDAMEVSESSIYRIKKYNNGDCVSEWYGSPEDLLGFMQEEA